MLSWVPNFLTILRLIAVPILLLCYLFIPSSNLVITSIFAVAAFTDWLDGYLARKDNSFSALGAFLDPVADKLLVTAALIIILDTYHNDFYILLFVTIIISREIAVSALREWMATIGKIRLMRVQQLAKLKTAVQMLGIGLMLLNYNELIRLVGFYCLFLATVLTLYSMCQYLKIAAKDLTFAAEHT